MVYDIFLRVSPFCIPKRTMKLWMMTGGTPMTMETSRPPDDDTVVAMTVALVFAADIDGKRWRKSWICCGERLEFTSNFPQIQARF